MTNGIFMPSFTVHTTHNAPGPGDSPRTYVPMVTRGHMIVCEEVLKRRFAHSLPVYPFLREHAQTEVVGVDEKVRISTRFTGSPEEAPPWGAMPHFVQAECGHRMECPTCRGERFHPRYPTEPCDGCMGNGDGGAVTSWRLSSSSDPLALAVVDGLGKFKRFGPHYSRRTPGSKTFTGVGQEIVLVFVLVTGADGETVNAIERKYAIAVRERDQIQQFVEDMFSCAGTPQKGNPNDN